MKTYPQTKEENLTEGTSKEQKEKVFNILKNTPLTFVENRG